LTAVPGSSERTAPPLDVAVDEATAVTDELLAAMGRLVPQLSRSADVPGDRELAEIVESPASILLVARDGQGAIVGSLTLVVFRIPTGVRAWIEDVVVDESARGRGVGEALSREALRQAAAAGARTVDLTSRPSRQAANRLYRRLGFVERDTNVYRWSGPPTG
jgi:ribosomal protein S18 acetylase RimI-like enzyme